MTRAGLAAVHGIRFHIGQGFRQVPPAGKSVGHKHVEDIAGVEAHALGTGLVAPPQLVGHLLVLALPGEGELKGTGLSRWRHLQIDKQIVRTLQWNNLLQSDSGIIGQRDAGLADSCAIDHQLQSRLLHARIPELRLDAVYLHTLLLLRRGLRPALARQLHPGRGSGGAQREVLPVEAYGEALQGILPWKLIAQAGSIIRQTEMKGQFAGRSALRKRNAQLTALSGRGCTRSGLLLREVTVERRTLAHQRQAHSARTNYRLTVVNHTHQRPAALQAECQLPRAVGTAQRLGLSTKHHQT